MCEVLRYGDVETMDTILNLKAALWALVSEMVWKELPQEYVTM